MHSNDMPAWKTNQSLEKGNDGRAIYLLRDNITRLDLPRSGMVE
jgi:hypothetical protein